MGTSMAFYWLENRNLTPESIREKLPILQERAGGKNQAMAGLLMGFLQKQDGADTLPPEVQAMLDGLAKGAAEVTAAYSAAARWIPIFEANMCEGFNAGSRDTDHLSELFGVPVLACSIFDSDVLMVSYSDRERGIALDYAKPNFAEFEEFDAECYRTEFPEFLVDYCGEAAREKLAAIWDSEEYTFADDRMFDICELLGAQALYGGDEIPEGLIKIT